MITNKAKTKILVRSLLSLAAGIVIGIIVGQILSYLVLI